METRTAIGFAGFSFHAVLSLVLLGTVRYVILALQNPSALLCRLMQRIAYNHATKDISDQILKLTDPWRHQTHLGIGFLD